MIDPILKENKLREVGNRCQWIDPPIMMRCQNTMSLKCHHRTYTRYGNELLSDLTVLCPRHHEIADVFRKSLLGQNFDIILERQNEMTHSKFKGLSFEKEKDFLERSIRDWKNIIDFLKGNYPLSEILAWLDVIIELSYDGVLSLSKLEGCLK